MENPLKKIEDEKGFMDMGQMGYYVFKGALEAGACFSEAIGVTSAYFKGMISASLTEKDDDAEDS